MRSRHLPESLKSWILKYIEEKQSKYPVQYRKIFKLLINEMQTPGDFGLFVRNDSQLNKIRNEHWMDKNQELWEKLEPLITPELF